MSEKVETHSSTTSLRILIDGKEKHFYDGECDITITRKGDNENDGQSEGSETDGTE